MAYSKDYIKRAVAYKQEGYTFKELQQAFNISSATYYDWEKKLKNGHYDVKVKRERKRKIDKEALRRVVTEKPDSFLWELAAQFGCTPPAVFYALEKLKITRKKRPILIRKYVRKNEQNIHQG